MYRLNVCNLSGTFEKSFGLTNFTRGYTAVLGELNAAVEGVNEFPYTKSPRTLEEYLEYQDWQQDYRLFCKLAHFFDDFNFFINESVRTRTEHDSKHSVDRRLRDFIRRVESMKIPQQIQDTITGFLKVQRAKAALVTTRENSWLVPNLLQSKNLHMISGKPKNYSLTEKDRKRRLGMLAQISRTWQKFPELRLIRLLAEVIPAGTDIGLLEDVTLIQLLKDFEVKS